MSSSTSIQSLIRSAKSDLRKRTSSKLRELSESEVQVQSEAITELILSSPVFQQSKTVSCYLSMNGEADTRVIVREILQQGKTLYVPKIVNREESKMDLFRVYSNEDLNSLPSGVWGIKEPGYEWNGQKRASINDEESDPLDLMLIPGVAFDKALSRLGHGKGYYDRFINSYKAKSESDRRDRPLPQLFALSLREQLVQLGQIPMTNRDCRMDAIVTPDGIITSEPTNLEA